MWLLQGHMSCKRAMRMSSFKFFVTGNDGYYRIFSYIRVPLSVGGSRPVHFVANCDVRSLIPTFSESELAEALQFAKLCCCSVQTASFLIGSTGTVPRPRIICRVVHGRVLPVTKTKMCSPGLSCRTISTQRSIKLGLACIIPPSFSGANQGIAETSLHGLSFMAPR